MGTFDRLSNVAKGALSNALGDLERANPAAVYEAAIEQGISRLDQHKKAAAGLAAQRNRLAEGLEALGREREQVARSLALAVQEGDDDTAIVLVARQDELDSALESKGREHEQVALQVAETVASLETLRSDIDALKREQHSALAKLQVAEASIEIQESASGFSDSATAKGLDSVRSSINVLNAQANEGYLDAEGNSVRGQAAAMGRKAAEADARAQLDRMKKQRAKPDSSAAPSDGDDDEPAPKAPARPKRDL